MASSSSRSISIVGSILISTNFKLHKIPNKKTAALVEYKHDIKYSTGSNDESKVLIQIVQASISAAETSVNGSEDVKEEVMECSIEYHNIYEMPDETDCEVQEFVESNQQYLKTISDLTSHEFISSVLSRTFFAGFPVPLTTDNGDE